MTNTELSTLKYKQNLHTHTVFCDGKDTPEELICEAISREFNSLGFSIHSFLRRKTIDNEKIEAYKAEILRLKEKYRGSFDVFLGIEYELWTELSPTDFDYTIAAVHYLLTEDGYRNFDTKLDGTLAFVDNYFNGDSMAFAKTYYETLSKIPERGNFDIVAHFDIITKYNEQHPFIDTDSKEYMSYAFGAIDALAGKIPFFELNTGAIGRGYRSTPYPCMPILKELAAKGFGAVITSDCHNKLQLDCYFDEARELLSEAGFKSQFVLTNKGFEEISL